MAKDSIKRGTISSSSINFMSKEGFWTKRQGPLFLSNGYGKAQSRYLSASVGSCHDLCKYGKKQDSEDDRKHYIFERFMANRVTAISVQNHVKDLIIRGSKERSKIKVNEHTLASENTVNIDVETRSLAESPDDKVNHLNILNLRKQNKKKHAKKSKSTINQDEQKKSSISTENSVLNKNVASFMKETVSSSALKVIMQKSARVRKPSPFHKFENMKKNASFPSRNIGGFAKHVSSVRSMHQLNRSTSLDYPNNRKQKVCKNFEMPEYGELKFVKLQKASVGSRKPSHGVLSLKARKCRNLQIVTQEREEKHEKHDGNNDEKFSEIIEPRIEKTCLDYKLKNCCSKDDGYSSESLVREISEIEEVQMKGNHETITEIFQPKSENKGLDHIHENVVEEDNGYASDSLVSEVIDLCEIEEIQMKEDYEKTVIVIEPRSVNIGLDHNLENNNEDGVSLVSEVSELSENEETKMKQNHDKRRARTPTSQLDDNSSLPYKVKFKRGRVIELRAAENVGPRMLRFRRGRELDENPNSEVIKKSLRRREASDSNTSMLKQLDSEAKAVVLKHQDQQKKEMLSLFNIMIEETASKLEESRKSKVRALVGAFETVISLQEAKCALVV